MRLSAREMSPSLMTSLASGGVLERSIGDWAGTLRSGQVTAAGPPSPPHRTVVKGRRSATSLAAGPRAAESDPRPRVAGSVREHSRERATELVCRLAGSAVDGADDEQRSGRPHPPERAADRLDRPARALRVVVAVHP